jgi:hypothetical protein
MVSVNVHINLKVGRKTLKAEGEGMGQSNLSMTSQATIKIFLPTS